MFFKKKTEPTPPKQTDLRDYDALSMTQIERLICERVWHLFVDERINDPDLFYLCQAAGKKATKEPPKPAASAQQSVELDDHYTLCSECQMPVLKELDRCTFCGTDLRKKEQPKIVKLSLTTKGEQATEPAGEQIEDDLFDPNFVDIEADSFISEESGDEIIEQAPEHVASAISVPVLHGASVTSSARVETLPARVKKLQIKSTESSEPASSSGDEPDDDLLKVHELQKIKVVVDGSSSIQKNQIKPKLRFD